MDASADTSRFFAAVFVSAGASERAEIELLDRVHGSREDRTVGEREVSARIGIDGFRYGALDILRAESRVAVHGIEAGGGLPMEGYRVDAHQVREPAAEPSRDLLEALVR